MRTIPIGTSITHQLAPLFRRVSQVHNEALEPLELRAVEAHILAALHTDGPSSVREVQTSLGIRGSTLTGALDRLEQKGFLRREPAPGDRRSFRLVAEPVPAKKARAFAAALEEAEQRSFAGLSRTEQKQLLALLTKANQHLIEGE